MEHNLTFEETDSQMFYKYNNALGSLVTGIDTNDTAFIDGSGKQSCILVCQFQSISKVFNFLPCIASIPVHTLAARSLEREYYLLLRYFFALVPICARPECGKKLFVRELLLRLSISCFCDVWFQTGCSFERQTFPIVITQHKSAP